ncbi:hypothetical protein N9390_09855, partial [Gammaproteobacteria bacterium]|nr:hypothetical protein [Gammaproteobacteria bacterium]
CGLECYAFNQACLEYLVSAGLGQRSAQLMGSEGFVFDQFVGGIVNLRGFLFARFPSGLLRGLKRSAIDQAFRE